MKPIEEINPKSGADQRKAKPQKEQILNCPRCNSTNTKFCYYNNYSLTQPRYFCKTCRRYWTEGGSLRNIPVGGGSRKNKRSSSASSSTSSTSSKLKLQLDHNPKTHEGRDLNLAFPATQDFRSISDQFVQVPNSNNIPPSSASTSSHLSALELLTGLTSRGFNSFVPVPDQKMGYTSGFHLAQEFKPSLNFTLDGLGSGYGSYQQGVQVQENSGRVFFPFEDLKQAPNTNDHQTEQNRGQEDSPGYWTGMLGGGAW